MNSVLAGTSGSRPVAGKFGPTIGRLLSEPVIQERGPKQLFCRRVRQRTAALVNWQQTVRSVVS